MESFKILIVYRSLEDHIRFYGLYGRDYPKDYHNYLHMNYKGGKPYYFDHYKECNQSFDVIEVDGVVSMVFDGGNGIMVDFDGYVIECGDIESLSIDRLMEVIEAKKLGLL